MLTRARLVDLVCCLYSNINIAMFVSDKHLDGSEVPTTYTKTSTFEAFNQNLNQKSPKHPWTKFHLNERNEFMSYFNPHSGPPEQTKIRPFNQTRSLLNQRNRKRQNTQPKKLSNLHSDSGTRGSRKQRFQSESLKPEGWRSVALRLAQLFPSVCSVFSLVYFFLSGFVIFCFFRA